MARTVRPYAEAAAEIERIDAALEELHNARTLLIAEKVRVAQSAYIVRAGDVVRVTDGREFRVHAVQNAHLFLYPTHPPLHANPRKKDGSWSRSVVYIAGGTMSDKVRPYVVIEEAPEPGQ